MASVRESAVAAADGEHTQSELVKPQLHLLTYCKLKYLYVRYTWHAEEGIRMLGL